MTSFFACGPRISPTFSWKPSTSRRYVYFYLHTGNWTDVVFCAQVTSCSVSSDGLQVCASTSTGSLGVLDIPSHAYRTLLRSHAGAVTSAAFDPSPDRDEVNFFYNFHIMAI
jgi:WD40 repeat protein